MHHVLDDVTWWEYVELTTSDERVCVPMHLACLDFILYANNNDVVVFGTLSALIAENNTFVSR